MLRTDDSATPTAGTPAQTSPVEAYFSGSDVLFSKGSTGGTDTRDGRSPGDSTASPMAMFGAAAGADTPSPGTVTAVQTPSKETTNEELVKAVQNMNIEGSRAPDPVTSDNQESTTTGTGLTATTEELGKSRSRSMLDIGESPDGTGA